MNNFASSAAYEVYEASSFAAGQADPYWCAAQDTGTFADTQYDNGRENRPLLLTGDFATGMETNYFDFPEYPVKLYELLHE